MQSKAAMLRGVFKALNNVAHNLLKPEQYPSVNVGHKDYIHVPERYLSTVSYVVGTVM